jgi:hypothetical protein
VHLAVSILLALAVFYYMGFRPLEISGYGMAGLLVVILAVVAGFGMRMLDNVNGSRPVATASAPGFFTTTPIPVFGPTLTPLAPATLTLAPPTAPATDTLAAITDTPGITTDPTLVPTPVYGHIHSGPPGDGAMIRVEPNGAPITTVQNDYLVILLPDQPVTLANVVWVRVRVNTSSREIVGWVQLSLIVTATPSGPVLPTPTATIKPASP